MLFLSCIAEATKKKILRTKFFFTFVQIAFSEQWVGWDR